MAAKDIPVVVAGSTNHPEIHNDLRDVAVQIDYDSFIAANVGQVLKKQAGGLWAADSDLQASSGTGWGVDMAFRFVAASGGSDLDDGLSPDTAMATVQAAVDSVQQSGIGQGGYIYLGKGEHTANNITIDTPMHIIGLGRRTTRLNITQNDAAALVLNDGFTDGYVGKLQITDKSNSGSGINARSGIHITDNGQESIFEDILIDGLGDTYGGVHSFDDTPAGIRIEGPNVFGDWMQFRNIRTRGQQTSFAITSGSNGWISNCAVGGARHAVHILKRDGIDGDSCSWRFFETQFIGGLAGTTADSFSVLVDNDNSGQNQGAIRFIACQLEVSAATAATQGFYINLTDVIFADMQMTVTHMPVGGKALHVGPNGQVVFGQYAQDGFVIPDDVQVDSGGSLSMWQPTDWTGP